MLPIRRVYAAWVTSVAIISKGTVSVTVWAPSLGLRPGSSAGLPMVKLPAAIGMRAISPSLGGGALKGSASGRWSLARFASLIVGPFSQTSVPGSSVTVARSSIVPTVTSSVPFSLPPLARGTATAKPPSAPVVASTEIALVFGSCHITETAVATTGLPSL